MELELLFLNIFVFTLFNCLFVAICYDIFTLPTLLTAFALILPFPLFVVPAEPKAKSTPKSHSLRKTSNAEIMQRSKLFKDSPKRGPRSEILFDKLVEQTQKKQKEEKSMRDFEKTLEQIDEDEDRKTGNLSEDIIDIEDEEPVRRRVIPPIPGRRAINKRNMSNGKEM